MLSKYVLPGDRVEMRKLSRDTGNSEEEKNRFFVSKVNEILSDDSAEIMMPMEKTKLILLPVDQEFEVFFHTKGGLFQCYATVKDRYKTNNIYLLVIELTTSLKKHQRREFYRYGCAMEIETRPLEEEEITAAGKKEKLVLPDLPYQKSIVADISGGGARFITAGLYEPNSVVYCKCILDIGGRRKEYVLTADVLYIKKIENKEGIYEHRVKFRNIPAAEREEIIRFIFEEERKNRKRETGI